MMVIIRIISRIVENLPKLCPDIASSAVIWCTWAACGECHMEIYGDRSKKTTKEEGVCTHFRKNVDILDHNW